MKKIPIIFVTFCLAAITLVGCSSNDSTSKESTAKESTAKESTTKDATPTVGNEGKEIVKLTAIIAKHPLTQELSKMKWLQEAEARAGVEIKWEEITADWAQKKGALLASGDIPDLIVGGNPITDGDFAQFPGLFQDLSKLMELAPNVQAMFAAKPETKVIATQLDGAIYGLPKYQRYWPVTTTRQFINQKWLDKLGLQMPTTWDELYDVLVQFKQKDPNGNGNANDEIPMDFAPTGTVSFGAFMPTVLLGSQGITLTDNSGFGYFLEDGKLKNFLVDERYKEVVAFLAKCYKASLINKEVFTQDYSKFQSVARGTGDTAAVGFTWGWEVTDRFGNTLAPQYTSMSPLKVSSSSNDKLSWSYDYNALNYGTNMITMSAKTKNKEAAMRFINELYDPKVSMQVLFGSLGTNIADNGNGSYSVLPPADSAMDPGTWKWTTSWADIGPMYIADSLDLTLGTDMQSVGKQTEPVKAVLDKINLDTEVLPSMFMKYSTADNNTLSLSNTNMMTLALAKWSKWITSGGIDNEWNAYVKDIEKIGLPKNIEIMQSYYDKYKAK
jgi:putative aldouronate transport system substrate-binding protein